MSAGQGSNTHIEEVVYVRLLDEGTEVLRPTKGLRISEEIFELLIADDYDPEDETWEFPPGTRVICEREYRDGEEVWVAVRAVLVEK